MVRGLKHFRHIDDTKDIFNTVLSARLRALQFKYKLLYAVSMGGVSQEGFNCKKADCRTRAPDISSGA